MNKFWFILTILFGLPNGKALAQKCSKLILTGPPDSVPSSWTRDGKPIGAAVEYAKRISRADGATQSEIRAFPTASESLQAVYRGEVDLIFQSIGPKS